MKRATTCQFVAASALAVGIGCTSPGDLSLIPDDGAGPATEAENTWQGSTLQVRVTWYHDPDALRPAAGATVALDAPGGTRTEQTTDANGEVSFTGLDFGLGTAAVTAYLSPFPLASRVGIAEDSGTIDLWLTSYGRQILGPMITISGTMDAMQSPLHGLAVTATTAMAMHDWPGRTWSFSAPAGQPFLLVAEEYERTPTEEHRDAGLTCYAWFVSPQPALFADTTIEIEPSTQVSFKTATGSVALPTRQDSGLRKEGHLWARVRSGYVLGAFLGNPTSIRMHPDREGLDYDIVYIELPGVWQPHTEFVLAESYQETRRSVVYVPGYPTNGPQGITFIDPPDLVTPSDRAVPYPLHEPIAWNDHGQGTEARISLYRGTQLGNRRDFYDHLVWTVDVPRGLTSAAIPEPPSTMSAEDVLGLAPLLTTIVLRDGPTAARDHRWAESLDFRLDPR